MPLTAIWRWNPAKWMTVALGLTYAGFILYPQMTWQLQSVTTFDWLGGALFVTGPIMAGFTAWHVREFLRLMGSGSGGWARPYRATALVLGLDATLSVLVFLLAALVSWVVAWTAGTPLGPGWTLLVPQLANVAACCAAGYAAGVLLDSRYTAPLVALGLFLLPWAAFAGPLPATLFDLGSATGVPYGFEPNPKFLAAQTALAMGLACIGATLTVKPPGWAGVGRKALAVTGACCALAAVLVLTAQPTIFRFRPASTDVACSGADPEICLATQTDAVRAVIDSVSREEYALLRSIGVPAPAQVRQVFAESLDGLPIDTNPPGQVRPLPLDATTGSTRELAVEYLTYPLVADVRCVSPENMSDAAFSSVMIAVGWVQAQMGMADVAGHAEQRALAAAGARGKDWVAKTLKAAGSCELRQIPEPL